MFFCFARDSKKEILVIDFNTDKFLIISREPRFHPKQFSKAALGYEYPKKLSEEELICDTECVWCFAVGDLWLPISQPDSDPGEEGQGGSSGDRASIL